MKRILSILFVVVLLTVALMLASCELKHTHEFIDTVVAPDCETETAGYTIHTCSCGEEYIDSYVDAHEFVVEEVAGTCHDAGYTKYVCKLCNYEKHDTFTEIDPENHVFFYPENYWDAEKAGKGNVIETVASTCVDYGYSTYECIYCATSSKLDVVEELTSHTYGEWKVLTESTCLTEGFKERYCTLCNAVEQEVVSRSAHLWGEYEFVVSEDYINCLYEERACIACKTVEPNPVVIRDVLALELREDGNGGKCYVVTGINPGKDCTTIVIPEYVMLGEEKIYVTEINSGAFMYDDHIETVYIPTSVTKIGALAFTGCSSLEQIVYGGVATGWEAIDKVDGWFYGGSTTIVTK